MRSAVEIEKIVSLNRAEKEVSVYSANKTMVRHMQKLAAISPLVKVPRFRQQGSLVVLGIPPRQFAF